MACNVELKCKGSQSLNCPRGLTFALGAPCSSTPMHLSYYSGIIAAVGKLNILIEPENFRRLYWAPLKTKIMANESDKFFNRPVGGAIMHSSLERRPEVQISGRSNWTQCCQWLAAAAAFFRTQLFCRAQRREMGPQTRCTLWRNKGEYNERFDLTTFFEHTIWISSCIRQNWHFTSQAIPIVIS